MSLQEANSWPPVRDPCIVIDPYLIAINGHSHGALILSKFIRAGDRIRTGEYQLGRLMPYHLATPAIGLF